jgi:hypothetical protein
MTRMDEPITDSQLVTIKNLKITKYNRTASALKGLISFVQDIPDNTMVSITYSLLFPSMILFIPFNHFYFHTWNFTNIIDVLPLKNRTTTLRHSKDKWVWTNFILNSITCQEHYKINLDTPLHNLHGITIHVKFLTNKQSKVYIAHQLIASFLYQHACIIFTLENPELKYLHKIQKQELY